MKFDHSGWDELFAERGATVCPKCGGILIGARSHADEICERARKFRALKTSMIESGLWDSDDEKAVDEYIRQFDLTWALREPLT